ncbi:hypothetical protein E2C01_004720 [Portunus trituberculatus]|uniref:Uncharacterized protein n=1 Tax=Portunus trituberculatus TaxID=210409 RepID=A0A5B7CQR2_PORTR|nr:hypothetical protein [Portunus trituberculatus]
MYVFVYIYVFVQKYRLVSSNIRCQLKSAARCVPAGDHERGVRGHQRSRPSITPVIPPPAGQPLNIEDHQSRQSTCRSHLYISCN